MKLGQITRSLSGGGFAALLLLTFLHALTIGILFYFPRFVVELGGSSTQAGALAALALLPMLPGPWARWAERRPPLSLIAWGLVISSLSRWGIAQTESLTPLLILWSLLGGVGFSWCFVPMLRLAHELAPPAKRGRAIAWFVSAMQLGNAGGSFLGGYWVTQGNFTTMFAAASVILLLAVIPLMALRQPISSSPNSIAKPAVAMPWRKNVAISLPYLVAMLAIGMAFGIPLQFMPVHLAEVSAQTGELLSPAAFLSTSFLAILASRLLLAHVLDGPWRKHLYWFALVVLGGALLSLAAVRSDSALTLVAIAYGLGYSLLFPVVSTQGLADAPAEGRAAMSSNLTLGFELGTRGTAIFAGMVADAWGFTAMFGGLAIFVLLVTGIWGWKSMREPAVEVPPA